MAETAKFRAAAFNPETLPRATPAFGGTAPSIRPPVRAVAPAGYAPPAFNPEVLPRATPAVDVIPETKPTFRVANPEVLPKATPPGSAFAAADSALGREAALAGERTAGRVGFRSAAGAAGRGLGVLLSAPIQVPAMAIGATAAAANDEAQRIGLGKGGDYMSDSPASLERSQRFNPTGAVDVRNMAAEKLRAPMVSGEPIPPGMVAAQMPGPPAPGSATPIAPAPTAVNFEDPHAGNYGRGITEIVNAPGQEGRYFTNRIAPGASAADITAATGRFRGEEQRVTTPEGAETIIGLGKSGKGSFRVRSSETTASGGADTSSPRMPRSYGFGSLFGAQVEAGAERGRRWEAEQGVRQQTADTAQAKGETDAAKALIDLNKAPDAPKIGLTEVQDPTDPLKMRYLLTEDGVPSPTSIDPSDPVQAQALRAFTRARMAGGLDARIPFDDFLKFARQQQTGGVDGGPK